MYAVLFLGDDNAVMAEDREPAICESYEGMQYAVYRTRKAAEASIRDLELSTELYKVVPLPGYAGPDTEFGDMEHCCPSITEHPCYDVDTHSIRLTPVQPESTTQMYVILSRKGYDFGSEGMDYVIKYQGKTIMQDMNKTLVEREFFKLIKR